MVALLDVMLIVSAVEYWDQIHTLLRNARHHQNDPTYSAGYYFWLLTYYSKSLTATSPMTRSATEKIELPVNPLRPSNRSQLTIDCPGDPYTIIRKPIKNPAIQ